MWSVISCCGVRIFLQIQTYLRCLTEHQSPYPDNKTTDQYSGRKKTLCTVCRLFLLTHLHVADHFLKRPERIGGSAEKYEEKLPSAHLFSIISQWTWTPRYLIDGTLMVWLRALGEGRKEGNLRIKSDRSLQTIQTQQKHKKPTLLFPQFNIKWRVLYLLSEF